MKATDMLKKQHREVEKLFKAALKTSSTGENRRSAVALIVEKLTAHAAIEEEIFYPAYKHAVGTMKGEDLVREAYEEHRVVKFLLSDLPEVDPSDEDFDAKVTVLKEIVEHHVEEEEGELFPSAEKKLGTEVLEDLGERMQARMSEVGAEGRPRSRNNGSRSAARA